MHAIQLILLLAIPLHVLAAPEAPVAPAAQPTHSPADAKFRFHFDSTKAPNLTEWMLKELQPVVEQWYPKLIALLPGAEFTAPNEVFITFCDDLAGNAALTSGNKISLNAKWFATQLEGEAKGCVVHELAHVVQSYWLAPTHNSKPSPTPRWVCEGVCDYLRWFLYEPASKGAALRDPARAKYDASYRISANFIDWVITFKDKNLLEKLNTAAREGRYSDDLWKTWTGTTLPELAAEWRQAVAAGTR